MGKALFIAEKPSVAQEFAKALKYNTVRRDGYVESDEAVVTWCVGHLVTMSYPECYDPALKRWSLDTLPFIPAEWKYEVIEGVKKQFDIVSGLLNRPDVDTIYVCTDSGREGEYIYRLVEQQAHVEGKKRRRVWIDSQTEEEILRGIREAKDLSEYDSLADAAYLRAKEDYLMGINFSRVLTLKYGNTISNYLKLQKGTVIAVGRVMTCVQGMIVKREREIRQFVETPFYRVLAKCSLGGSVFEAEWRAAEGSKYFARVVGQALGIAPMERAPPTVGFPFVASRHVEIRAMPRKRPAVVQRPDHGNVFLLDIPEQHRQIDIPAVQIVQVDHVGLQLPQPADQPCSSEGGKMPFQSRQSTQEMVQTVLEKRPDVKMLCVLGGLLSLPLSRDGVDREAVLLSAVRNLQHDVSRTAVIRGVDLNNRFSHSLPLHSARPMEQPLAVSRISRQTALFFASS